MKKTDFYLTPKVRVTTFKSSQMLCLSTPDASSNNNEGFDQGDEYDGIL